MPFLAHFSLKEHPFSLTPNSELFFPAEDHQKALTSLVYAVWRGEGVVKVVGEVGTGKTLLCRVLINQLEDRAAVAYLLNPQDDPDWLVRAVCREFGVEPANGQDPFHELDRFLLKQHREGRRAVLLVDEAQALGVRGLETIRRLSNLETDKSKLLQIILFGQPELDRLLQSHELRQLNQRVVFSFALRPFSPAATMQYVRHRALSVARDLGSGAELFDRRALKAIARASRGVPRLINIIADKSMLAAYSLGARRIGARHVRAALKDSKETLGLRRWAFAGWRRAAMLAVPMVVLAAGGWVLAGEALPGGWSADSFFSHVLASVGNAR